VNFWRPGGQSFAALSPGELFLFKLKAPFNAIAGGGFYVRYIQLPLSLAWDVFGLKNGAADYRTFRQRLINLRSDRHSNPQIGCIILTSPFFFREDEWIEIPNSFAKNIVSGKTYDTQTDTDGNVL
jgi:putative restriction endonuclease